MCPCDATCKAVRLVEIFIDLSRRKSVILGEETAKQHLPRAELRDGKRPSVLAFKTHWHRFRFAEALAFRGRSPCVTKRSTHLLVFIVLFSTRSPFPCFPCDPWTPKSPSNQRCKITLAFLRLKKAYFEKAY